MERLADCVILPAGPGDADELARVHIRAWRETYHGQLPPTYLAAMDRKVHARRWRLQLARCSELDIVLVAENERGLVGYCAGTAPLKGSQPSEAEVSTLYVLRSFQRVGVGRRLMVAAARIFHARGAGSLVVWVLSSNRPARSFYQHLGGEPAGERAVRGWGGGLREAAYRWAVIGSLTS